MNETRRTTRLLPAAWLLAAAVAGAPAGADAPPRGAIARFGQVRLHHGTWVKGLAFSPDGRTLASCGGQYSQPGDVSLWDVATGRLLRALPGPSRGGTAVTFSPDGRDIITAGQDRTIEAREAGTGQTSRRVRLAGVRGNWVAFSPDGTQLAVGETSGVVFVQPATGKVLGTVSGATYCTFSPDGRFAALTSTRDTKVGAQLWDARTRKMLRQVCPGGRRLSVPALSPGASLLAAGCMYGPDRGMVLLWEALTGKLVRKLAGPGTYVYQTAFSPDGRYLAATGRTGLVRVWETASGKVVRDLAAGSDRIETVAFSPDGRLLVAGGYTGQIRAWMLPTFTERFAAAGHRGPVTTAVACDDGRLVVTVGSDGTARVWDGASGRQLYRLETGSVPVHAAAVSGDGETLVTDGGAEKLLFWNPADGRLVRSVKLASWTGGLLAFSREGDRLFALGPTGSTHEVDVASGAVQLLQRGRQQALANVAVSDDLRTAASFERSYVFAWDVRTGHSVAALTVPGVSYLYALDVSPTGRLIAGDAGQKVVLVELDSGGIVRQVAIPRRRPGQGRMAFSPDGTILAVTDSDGKIGFWSLRDGEKLGERIGHRGNVTSLRFLPDGARLLSGGSDGTAVLWDVADIRPREPDAPAGADAGRLDAAWGDLASADAARAHEAMFILIAGGEETVRLLAGRLRAVRIRESDHVRSLIARLGSDRYADRRKATEELSALGPAVEPALREALGGATSEEVRARARHLLEAIGDPRRRTGQTLRELRAVHVLERIGSPAARVLLATLAEGAQAAYLTRRAAAACRRLGAARP